jgi:hypothetical protein
MQTNVLYYGDNLDTLRRYLPDASVDLVYLDPPLQLESRLQRHLPRRVRQRHRCPAPRLRGHLALGPIGRGSALDELEAIRLRFRPDPIRILLVGESPPPSRGFFYTGDSTLFTHTSSVMIEQCGMPAQSAEFLTAFQEAGFFLEDFSTKRGDKPARRPDANDTQAAVERVAEMIRHHMPVAVVAVLLSIRALVDRSVRASGADVAVRSLEFPHWRDEGTQNRYRRGLAEILREFGCGN